MPIRDSRSPFPFLKFTQRSILRIPSSSRCRSPILDAMQSPSQPAASNSSGPEPPSFAGFLSALASPVSSPHGSAWNDETLADDVVTLSYENALKAHSRYKPQLDLLPIPKPDAPAENVSSPQESVSRCATPVFPQPPTAGGDLKTASITIRMSQAECAQLKQRAAEAGMTISAYLRSCTFEAETLRGQVKEALTQLRAAASAESKQCPSVSDRLRKSGWVSRILAHRGERKPILGAVS
jgi:hypothetical protein